MGLLLEIVEGTSRGRKAPLAGGVEIGREPGIALLLEDEQVSRHHARVEPDGDGAAIVDLESRNGTYVNDRPVSGRQRLEPGDRIRVGLTVLELRSEAQVARRPSAVGPVPPITQLGGGVLKPAAAGELARPPADVGGLMAEESEPAFVPSRAVEDQARAEIGGRSREGHHDALARLVDPRVKRQTHVAAFAVLAIAALAVAIFFGAR